MLLTSVGPKINSAIRFFLYVLIFWLPYSPAVVEGCVILSLILWVIKRGAEALGLEDWPSDLARTIFKFFKYFQPEFSPSNFSIGIFLAVCSLSVANSVFFEQSLHNILTKTLEWFIVYFLVLEVFTEKRHIIIFIIVFFITGLATGLDSLVQFYFTYKDIFLGHVIEPGSRPTAGFKAPNSLAAYLIVIIPVFTALLFYEGGKLRNRGAVFFALIFWVWSLVLTSSRGAWLGIFSAGMFLIFVYLYLKRQTKLYFLFGFVAVFAVSGVGLFFFKAEDVLPALSARHDTIDWRLGIWKDSLAMVRDRPLFGHGINTYMSLFERYRTGQGTSPTYAHNCYLQLMVETGMVGLGVFLWMMVGWFRASLSNIRTYFMRDSFLSVFSLGIFCGVFAFLVQSFFDTNFYSLQLSVYLWFMIGLQTAVSRLLSSASGMGAAKGVTIH